MNGIITEKDYPIQRVWLLKPIIPALPYIIVPILYLIFFAGPEKDDIGLSIYLFSCIGFGIHLGLIWPFLMRLKFHYSIEDKFLTLRQGILSKQQRHIPYGVIQNLFIKQNLFDRIFGLASLTIENASQGFGGFGAFTLPQKQKAFMMKMSARQQQKMEMVGFFGNKVSIPGLTKQNAEILKGIVLQKMKENPIDDSQSGL